MAGIAGVIGIVLLDQLVKFLIVTNLDLSAVATVIPGVLSLMRVHNYGVSFSMLEGVSSYLLAGVSIAVAAVMAALLKGRVIRMPVQRWAFICVIGGALSNAIDRLFSGYVVDMFRFDFVTFGIFNVADVFIIGGSLAFVIHWLVSDHRAARPKRAPRGSSGTFWERDTEPFQTDAGDPGDEAPHVLDYPEGRDDDA